MLFPAKDNKKSILISSTRCAKMSPMTSTTATPTTPTPPLISLIMPTRGRSELTHLALQCAMDQDYKNIEIVVFDDEDDPSFSELPSECVGGATVRWPDTIIRYRRLPRFPTLGDKRNAMCEEARGEIIAHVDSDDLSAPSRISRQVIRLNWLSGRRMPYSASITGFHTLPFYDIVTGQAYLYHLNSAYVCGTSLMYRKDFWREHPFPSTDIGEDLPYTSQHSIHRVSTNGEGWMVALLHDGNMSSRDQARRHPDIFPKISTESLPSWFHDIKNKWQWPRDCGRVSEISNDVPYIAK
jgi:glycosyltransferase involved in cell wall biosynthesis